MANALIAFNNRVDDATFSGGSYLPALPLTNLQNRRLKSVARSTDLLLASTQFQVDIGASKSARLFALVGHNLSLAATYRLRAGNDATFATTSFDTGWLEAWPRVYDSAQLDWLAPNWWTGKYLDEERYGYTWNLPILLPANAYYRYWKIEIDDSSRTDLAYVDIGRVFIGAAWQPVVNMSEGAEIGWQTNTQTQQSLSGAKFFQRRTPFRNAAFELGFMMDEEAFGNAFDMFRQVGIDKEVFYAYDPSDTVQLLRRSFLGHLPKLSPIKIKNFLLRGTSLEVEELI